MTVMRQKITRLLGLLVLFASPLVAIEINYTSPAFEIGKTSTGALLTNGFTFALGSFGNFTPTADNLNLWNGNFTALGTTNWDETFTQFSGTVTLSSNAAPFATTTQAYIWGYNFDVVGSASQWVLLTNPNWTFPQSSDLFPVSWGTSDIGTSAIFGALAPSAGVGANPYLQTLAAVPEPGTYAVLAGLAALGFAVWRRRAVRTS